VRPAASCQSCRSTKKAAHAAITARFVPWLVGLYPKISMSWLWVALRETRAKEQTTAAGHAVGFLDTGRDARQRRLQLRADACLIIYSTEAAAHAAAACWPRPSRCPGNTPAFKTGGAAP
jgi:hypothetical protein